MDIIIKTDICEIDQQEWNDFVANHPKGSVFQTPQMYRCYEKTPDEKPLILAAYHNTELVGILLAVVISERGFLKKQFSKRSIIHSGPIVKDDDPRILQTLLQAYDGLLPKNVIYTQIRNQFDQLCNCDVYRENGYNFEPHLNFLIHLDDEDSIWRRIGKGRLKQIKKAQRNGLTVAVYRNNEITYELLHKGYSVIREVYHRANLPLVDYSQIEATRDEGLLVMIVMRTKDGELVGCRFGLSFGKTLYGWYAGSHKQYYSLFPNDLLIWETLRWACANGYDVFDYGGAGSPNKPYGVRGFKQQMGGELVDFGRYEKVHCPWKMHIATNGYAIYRKLFKF